MYKLVVCSHNEKTSFRVEFDRLLFISFLWSVRWIYGRSNMSIICLIVLYQCTFTCLARIWRHVSREMKELLYTDIALPGSHHPLHTLAGEALAGLQAEEGGWEDDPGTLDAAQLVGQHLPLHRETRLVRPVHTVRPAVRDPVVGDTSPVTPGHTCHSPSPPSRLTWQTGRSRRCEQCPPRGWSSTCSLPALTSPGGLAPSPRQPHSPSSAPGSCWRRQPRSCSCAWWTGSG